MDAWDADVLLLSDWGEPIKQSMLVVRLPPPPRAVVHMC